MKAIFRLILFFIGFTVTESQEILFAPVFYNQCTGEYAGTYYKLLKDGKEYENSSWRDSTIALPELGKYILYNSEIDDSLEINIKNYGITRDTFNLRSITSGIIISSPPSGPSYSYCHKLADGLCIDYYHNGQINCYGNFKDGAILDTMRTFYKDGVLKSIIIDIEDKYRRTKYYSNGVVYYDLNKEQEYWKYYYINGQLKEELFWDEESYWENTYYPNGQLKSHDDFYQHIRNDSNGVLLEKFTKEEVFNLIGLFWDSYKRYECQMNFFTPSSGKYLYVIYNDYGRSFHYLPDSLEQIWAADFEKVILFKNGEEYKKIEFELDRSYEYPNQAYILYRKEDNEWIQEKRGNVEEIHQVIRKELKKLQVK